MSYISSYKKRVGSGGVVDTRTRLIYDSRKNFERSLKRDPSSITIKITDVGEVNISDDTKLVPCIINDFSENDQKSFDEKVIYVRHDENIGIGSYVEFDNYVWLVIFKEHKSANIYKSFIMRKCNQIIKYKHDGVIYDIPCIVKNLTQYSDGLQDIVYTSTPDARRSIMYAENSITSNIKLGERFLINNQRVFRVTHIQNFEYQDKYGLSNGVASCIAVYTSLRDDDDLENNLASNDNYEYDNNSNEDVLMVASTGIYRVDTDECIWEIEYISDKKDYINITQDKGVCKILSEMNFDLVGERFKLRALSIDNNVIFEKDITIVSFI